MLIKNSADRYGSGMIALHWAMLILIALAYAAIEFREIFPKGTPARDAMKTFHFMFGLSVLMLVMTRIALRMMSGPAPAIKPPQPALQARFGSAMHGVLYVFMIAMPIAGWMILSAEGKAVPFWGLTLPALVAQSKGFAKQIEELHEIGGKIGYALIGLHAAAALVHHYAMRDNTLRRMLPRG